MRQYPKKAQFRGEKSGGKEGGREGEKQGGVDRS